MIPMKSTPATRANWRQARDKKQARTDAGIGSVKRPRGQSWDPHQLGTLLPSDLAARLSRAAEALGVTQDTLVAQAVEAWVSTLEAAHGPFKPPPLEWTPPRGEALPGAIRLTWRVPEELDERLELAAAGTKQSKRAVIVEALSRHLGALEILHNKGEEF